ncbi:MAG: LPXTG cell wall anchor domain-containing protein, partial [Peptococcaceae bacterium]|nr:LPXTG cell wall anchor domain-containing protein [Peptococcaceae bacterium]
VIKFHNLGNNNYEVCADAACNKTHVTEITTDAAGEFHIEGLDADTYYLTETAAPAGYNKLVDPVTVTIIGATTGDDGKLTYTTVEERVLNNTGAKLPETGGIGTTIFYVLGAVLVLGAGIVLVTRKRMAE